MTFTFGRLPGNGLGHRRRDDAGDLLEPGFDGLDSREYRRVVDPGHEDLFRGKAEVAVSHEIELPADDPGADDEGDADEKLGDDQDAPKTGAPRPGLPAPFEGFDRMEGREKDRRIASRDQTDEQGEAEKQGNEPDQLRRSEPQVDPGDRLEKGEGEPDQDEGDHEGQQAVGRRFAQELAEQGPAARPDDLAQADLAGPLGRAGRGQVHEVDAGDPDDEQGDRARTCRYIECRCCWRPCPSYSGKRDGLSSAAGRNISSCRPGL